MNTFHYPGQEHQQNSNPPAVTTAPAPKPAPSAGDQQRRVIALQVVQKQWPNATITALINSAADIERFIRTGARPGDVTAHGSTAKTA